MGVPVFELLGLGWVYAVDYLEDVQVVVRYNIVKGVGFLFLYYFHIMKSNHVLPLNIAL